MSKSLLNSFTHSIARQIGRDSGKMISNKIYNRNYDINNNLIEITNLSKPSIILCLLGILLCSYIPLYIIYYWYKYYSIKNIKEIKYSYIDYINIEIPDRRCKYGFRTELKPIKKFGKTSIDEYIDIINEYKNSYKKYALFVTIPWIILFISIILTILLN